MRPTPHMLPPNSTRWPTTSHGRLNTMKTAVSATRSEEHTSELQSPCNLVCRLLLEKNKSQTLSKTAQFDLGPLFSFLWLRVKRHHRLPETLLPLARICHNGFQTVLACDRVMFARIA